MMGLYTWVSQYCCGEELQFQSKSHPTKEWGEMELDAIPVEVARNIKGDTQTCGLCGAVYEIKTVERSFDTVPMEIVKVRAGETEEEDEVDDEKEALHKRLSRIEKELGIRK
jgi:hypothetical protein